MSQRMSVTQALETHIQQHGGRECIAPELCPTKQHIYRLNSRNSEKTTDDFEVVLMYAKENQKLVREIGSIPEPYVILATDQQLLDLQRFSSQPISVDPTFNLGAFYTHQ